MNVLVVTNMYPTPQKPISGIFIFEQVEALREAGVKVDLLLIDGTVSKLNYLKGLFRFWHKLITGRYDLIHAHYVYAGWIARLQVGLPVVVTSHGSDTLGFEGRLLRILHPLVDAVTITSKQNQERGGLPDTYLLPCGVNTDVFQATDREEMRRKLGWDLDKKYMLYVGNENPLKRVDLIRAAYTIARQQRDDIELFLATSVSHNDIPKYLNAADVFVFASETEGAPVSIKEAAVCGLPIVSVDVGDVREIIEGIDGCYIVDRTAEALADGVIRALGREERIDGSSVVREYGKQATVDKILSIYQNVIDKRSRS